MYQPKIQGCYLRKKGGLDIMRAEKKIYVSTAKTMYLLCITNAPSMKQIEADAVLAASNNIGRNYSSDTIV